MSNSLGSDSGNKDQQKHFSQFLRQSTSSYLILISISLLIAFLSKTDLRDAMLKLEWESANIYLAVIALSLGICLTVARIFELSFPSFRVHRLFNRAIIGPMPIWACLYLALLTSFSEELLFRLCLQPNLGVILTSLLVGAFHLGPGGVFTAWTAMATLVSILLGEVYQYTSSIWPNLIISLCLTLIFLLSSTKKKAEAQATQS